MTRTPCSIDDCDRPSAGRGWCSLHWKRWRAHGDPLYVRPAPAPKPRCAVDGCERTKHGNVYCSKHYQRFVKNGDPLVVGDHYPGRNRLPVPSYAGLHKRLFYDRGKAAAYECVDCGAPADEWSYDGGCPNEVLENYRGTWIAYTTDQSMYSPRCRPCHRRRDESLCRERDAAGRWAPAATIHSIRTDRSES